MDFRIEDIWVATGILVGFQVTSFVWRISREVEVGKENDFTWLPPSDILNLVSMAVAMFGVFAFPILGFFDINFPKYAFGLAVLLFIGYPFALAGHYDMYNKKTKRSYLYFPFQEKVVIAIVSIFVVIYLTIAI